MNRMNYDQVRKMLNAAVERIIRCEPYLTKLDSAIGDGDHGIGMKNGMTAAKRYLEQSGQETNIRALFTGMANAMRDAMGGASGMIFSALFSGTASGMTTAEEITPAGFAEHMREGLNAIQEIGRAQVGDKTMVDALAPAVDAMLKHTGSFEEMLGAGEAAAKEGFEKTKDLIARFGRSKALGKRAIGHPDAGAASTWLILMEMKDHVCGTETPDPVVSQEEKTSDEIRVKWKKKIINDPADVVREEAEGFLAAFGKTFAAVPGVNGLVKREIPAGKTALVIGGGSGHEPMFGFFLGERLADAAANGNVFASPDPLTITKTAEAANRGGGVMFLYGNYAGDNLNFDRAAEQLEQKGIPVRTIRVCDDIMSAPHERRAERRGIAGDVLMVRIAGAACAELPLEEAFRVTAKARDSLYSIGVALEGATIPGQRDPIFSLPADEIEYGLGIHGEPGVERIKMQTADEIVDRLYSAVIADSGIRTGDTVVTYVNGLGSTTLMELMIMNRRLSRLLARDGIIVHDMDVNSLVITQEMAGASISLMKMDEELLKYYDLPCRSPYYTKP